MNIIYYEYYPHYMMGTIQARVVLPVIDFCILLNVDDEDTACVLQDVVEQTTPKKTLYALSDALYGEDSRNKSARTRHIKKVIKDLSIKGFHFGEWEEGSFYFSTVKAESKARKALRANEAELIELMR